VTLLFTFAMKLVALPFVTSALEGAFALVRSHVSNSHRAMLVVEGLTNLTYTPQDIYECRLVADTVFTTTLTSSVAIEKLVDACSVDNLVDDRDHVCPYYKDVLTMAFHKEPVGKLYTPEAFCKVTEAYMLGVRGAARIPNMGAGPLFAVKLSWKCEALVLEAIAPEDSLDSSKLPDFLYSMCVNQDCAHYLSSRTKWCKMEHPPTHSNAVCEGLSEFARANFTGLVTTAKGICDVYRGFAEMMGTNVKAYESVMHADTMMRAPIPDDKARALGSSRLVNDAGYHYFSENAGTPVTEDHKSVAAFRSSLIVVSALVGTLA